MSEPDALTDPQAAALAGLAELHADGPSAVALFDAQDRLRWANAGFRQLFGLNEALQDAAAATPGWSTLLRQQGVAERRRRVPQRSYAAELSESRCLWISETRRSDGGLLCVVADISALRSAPHPPQALARHQMPIGPGPDRARAEHELQQALSHSAGWPLVVALLHCEPTLLAGEMMLAGLRRDDACARVSEAELLLVLPATAGPQAEVIIRRLLDRLHRAGAADAAARTVEAVWGENAEGLLRRLEQAPGSR